MQISGTRVLIRQIQRQMEVFGRQGVMRDLSWNLQLSSSYLDNDLDSSTRECLRR